MDFEVSPHSGPRTSVLKRFNFRRKQEIWIPSIHTVLISGGKPLEGDTSDICMSPSGWTCQIHHTGGGNRCTIATWDFAIESIVKGDQNESEDLWLFGTFCILLATENMSNKWIGTQLNQQLQSSLDISLRVWFWSMTKPKLHVGDTINGQPELWSFWKAFPAKAPPFFGSTNLRPSRFSYCNPWWPV